MSILSQFSVSAAPVWVSGTTYALGAIVSSPADGYQQYVRVVAGAGATDPASDSTNWKPYAARAIKSIQRGTISILTGGTTGTATITSVTTGKSWLRRLGYTRNASGSSEQRISSRLELTNATTITATRGADTSGTTLVSWEITEYY